VQFRGQGQDWAMVGGGQEVEEYGHRPPMARQNILKGQELFPGGGRGLQPQPLVRESAAHPAFSINPSPDCEC
jgi:hypothetical protein